MADVLVSLVESYLDELEHELRDLPRDRRREVVRDIRMHIEAELADAVGPPGVRLTKADTTASAAERAVRGVLDRLGPPAEIARAARAELPAERARIAGREVAAIMLLLVGGFALLVGWFVGVVLLWTSTAWRTRDKVIGTLLVPGGLLMPLLLSGVAVNVAGTTHPCAAAGVAVAVPSPVAGSSGGAPPSIHQAVLGPVTCTASGGAGVVLGIVLMVVAIGGPIFSAIWLGRRARRR